MKKKTISIIGGGIAGLSAGIYGQLNGFDTKIYEMNARPGGQCTAWDKEGYRFDYCINWLAGSSSGDYNKLYRETHALLPETTIYRHPVRTRVIRENGQVFLVYANLDDWQDYMIKMAEEDSIAIQKMCSDMKRAAYIQPFSALSELHSMQEWFHKAVALFPVLPILRKYRKMDAATYIRLLKLKNHDLKYFLSRLYANQGYSALTMLLMAGWFHAENAGYPQGGSLPISERMNDYYHSLGGTLLPESKVKRIMVKNRQAAGVVLEDGTRCHSDFTISACDTRTTIYKLLHGRFPHPDIPKTDKNVTKFNPIVQVSFGVNQLLKSDSPSTLYCAHNSKIGSTELRTGYSIINYTMMDQSMAPIGKTSLILRFESPWDLWNSMKDSDYSTEKEVIKHDALKLIQKHYDIHMENIDVIDVASPLTKIKYTGVNNGTYEGFFPDKDPGKKNSVILPGLANLYLINHCNSPSGGVPSSIHTGKWVIEHLCRQERNPFHLSREHLHK